MIVNNKTTLNPLDTTLQVPHSFRDWATPIREKIFSYLNSGGLSNFLMTCKDLRFQINSTDSLWAIAAKSLGITKQYSHSWRHTVIITHQYEKGIFKRVKFPFQKHNLRFTYNKGILYDRFKHNTGVNATFASYLLTQYVSNADINPSLIKLHSLISDSPLGKFTESITTPFLIKSLPKIENYECFYFDGDRSLFVRQGKILLNYNMGTPQIKDVFDIIIRDNNNEITHEFKINYIYAAQFFLRGNKLIVTVEINEANSRCEIQIFNLPPEKNNLVNRICRFQDTHLYSLFNTALWIYYVDRITIYNLLTNTSIDLRAPALPIPPNLKCMYFISGILVQLTDTHLIGYKPVSENEHIESFNEIWRVKDSGEIIKPSIDDSNFFGVISGTNMNQYTVYNAINGKKTSLNENIFKDLNRPTDGESVSIFNGGILINNKAKQIEFLNFQPHKSPVLEKLDKTLIQEAAKRNIITPLKASKSLFLKNLIKKTALAVLGIFAILAGYFAVKAIMEGNFDRLRQFASRVTLWSNHPNSV